MTTNIEKIPDPKELEKEISDFLAKRFGDNVKLVSPIVMPEATASGESEQRSGKTSSSLNFHLKPEEVIAHLDQYVVKQDEAKAILATKICTHFNRIRRAQETAEDPGALVGSIKNNILMIGPTGVGKTYLIRLIANKLGVPFVKGDATKFSETGYVGGDVEDLVRDLVREADDDIELAQFGIVYIDEIDKIAGSHNLIGADVSRTGVQRALLKPMEETDVDLKVPHDPVSMIQEIERYRKTGNTAKRTINTKHILFIMSGAFSGLEEIIKRRLTQQAIGFGAAFSTPKDTAALLRRVRSEDLIEFGFESEFIGRLPVRAVFEHLNEADLFDILKNPNNPIVLGKKLDFAAYGIRANFEDAALRRLARMAHAENTGARGLVSAVERALLAFERRLPSTEVRFLPVTDEAIQAPEKHLARLFDPDHRTEVQTDYDRLLAEEQTSVAAYIRENRDRLEAKYGLMLTDNRVRLIAAYYSRRVMDIGRVIDRAKRLYEKIKEMELYFFQKHDINIVLEEDAVDYLIEAHIVSEKPLEELRNQLTDGLGMGLDLVRQRTGKNRFFISRTALEQPDRYVGELIRSGQSGESTGAASLPDPDGSPPAAPGV